MLKQQVHIFTTPLNIKLVSGYCSHCKPSYLAQINTYNIWSSMENNVCLFVCIPRQAEVTLGVPGRLRPQIFSTFGTTRVVGRQPNAPAAFIPG